MKKIISIVMLVCLLASFAACGQQNETAVAIITPEPVTSQTSENTEQAQVVVPDMAPVDQGAQANPNADADADQVSRNDSNDNNSNDNNSNADNSNNSNNSGNSGTDNSMSSADKLAAAQGYVGSTLSALQGAIGAPNSSEYVQSCLEDAAQEGMLYYDGFVVWTVQYNDGSEIVKGVS